MKALTTNGYEFEFDEQDLLLVESRRWFGSKRPHGIYVVAFGPTRYLHRLIAGAPAGTFVDHLDHNPLNNKRSNLRLASTAQNAAYKARQWKRNKSGYKGVHWNQTRSVGGWRAEVSFSGRKVRSKRFKTKIEAAREYDRLAKLIHGDFAKLNFPEGI